MKAGTSELYVREQLDRALKEIKSLKHRLELVERENIALKKSLYELSMSGKHNKKLPLLLDFVETPMRPFESHEDYNNNLLPLLPQPNSEIINGSGNNNELSVNANPFISDTTDHHHHHHQNQKYNAAIVTSAISSANALDDLNLQNRYNLNATNNTTGTSSTNANNTSNNNNNAPGSGSGSGGAGKDARQLVHKCDLRGHVGAVYCVSFSPCGLILGSGSFDKSIKLWDIGTQKEILSLKKHKLNVSDIDWSRDSSQLVSSSYDMTCKVWDVSTGKLLHDMEAQGFVQCVMFNPDDDSKFYHGTSRNLLTLCDTKQPPGNAAMAISNDSMINSLYVYRDGSYVLTGDSQGFLKTWDIRNGKPVYVSLNENANKPISCITMCRKVSEREEEPRLLAVNSYDNVLRIYDRGFIPPKTQRTLIHTLRGHKNKNWPIGSSFYQGKNYVMEGSKTDSLESPTRDYYSRNIESTVLLASGSSDPFVYLYDVGGPEGSGELVQKLDGHCDRVYSVCFHPFDPILASCSADFGIKIWIPKNLKFNKF